MSVNPTEATRFWPVQRQGYRTVYDAERAMDIVHKIRWTREQTVMVATSLNATPSHIVCYDWTGAEVFNDPDDRVPFGLCVLSGGHSFGDGDECTGCGFRPPSIEDEKSP